MLDSTDMQSSAPSYDYIIDNSFATARTAAMPQSEQHNNIPAKKKTAYKEARQNSITDGPSDDDGGYVISSYYS